MNRFQVSELLLAVTMCSGLIACQQGTTVYHTEPLASPTTSSSGAPLQTRWPIVLSHPWSNTSKSSFLGEEQDAAGKFEAYGVKAALEAQGAVVYQPDKLAYASHERRGQLLYKKCAGTTVAERLCEGSNPVPVDGIYMATLDYCGKPELRARHGFADEPSCQRGLQFNIICHSQGCPDSRYMLAAVTNEFSGELMYKHVASWTSLVGANKGTAQADWVQEMLAACLTPACKSAVLDAAFAVDSFQKNETLVADGSESVIALTRKYMLETTDMDCTPGRGVSCAPSFNQLYPLPVDADHPVLYQTFSTKINDVTHPCFVENRLWWEIVQAREGANDGNISVDSQQFTTYGSGSTGGTTPVLARWVMGTSDDPSKPHPGLNHMAFSSSKVPGMKDVSCLGEDNSAYHFSRIGFYQQLVAELVAAGY
jgi:triacylglycerol esterase/lipase EstA (alpha/beta hydrolase family)